MKKLLALLVTLTAASMTAVAAWERDELVKLEGVSTAAHVSGALDPVTARISSATGLSESGITIAIGMTFSILLELIGALLWYEALAVRPQESIEDDAPESAYQAEQDPSVTNITQPVTELRNAIEGGECRATVSAIREYMGCSQARAMELRRELIEAAA